MQVVFLGICCGPGVLFYLLLIFYCCRCFFYSLLSIFLFLSSSLVSFFCLFVCLCYPALLYVIRVPHTFPPCEISVEVWGVLGISIFTKLLFSHASLNPNDVLCQVSLFIFCVLFPFQFVSMHNVLFTMQISFQLYTKPAPNYISKCYLHCSHLILCSLCLCLFFSLPNTIICTSLNQRDPAYYLTLTNQWCFS